MIDMARRRSRAKRITSSAIVLGVAIGFAAPAQAAKGPGGNDVGTVENLFKIPTDAISKYRAEVIWQDEVSARVLLQSDLRAAVAHEFDDAVFFRSQGYEGGR